MGSVPNPKWPFGLSHNRSRTQRISKVALLADTWLRHGSTPSAGWARQENINDLPIATAMAGVDFRLSPYAYRELHWHRANEWSLMLAGSVRISAVNDYGETTFNDLMAGDVWFFPSGIPHSIQTLEAGCEFLLVFDQGNFDESGTFLASELFERMPREVLAKNFRTDVSSFEGLPDGQLYIFPGKS